MNIIELFELFSDLYPIKLTSQKNITISYTDFKNVVEKYHGTDQNRKYYTSGENPDTFTKTIELTDHQIDIKRDLKDRLFDDYTKHIIHLCQNNRDQFKTNEKFDINIKKWLENCGSIDTGEIDRYLTRAIISKINNCRNYINYFGNLGLGQFIIVNENTHNYLHNIMKEELFNTGVEVLVNNKVENNTILIGRKNEIKQPGVLLVINDETNIIDNKLNIKYDFVDTGFNPQHHFYLIKIKTLKLERKEKLKRLYEL